MSVGLKDLTHITAILNETFQTVLFKRDYDTAFGKICVIPSLFSLQNCTYDFSFVLVLLAIQLFPFHTEDRSEIPLLLPYPRAGSNNSIGLPSGSSTMICLPPGPTSISFLKCTPSFLSSAIRVGKSCTWRTIRFQPPGSC